MAELELFPEIFAPATPKAADIAPRRRREHAGGEPIVAWENGEQVPVDLAAPVSDFSEDQLGDVAKQVASRALVGLVDWLESPFVFTDSSGAAARISQPVVLQCRLAILKLYLSPGSYVETEGRVPTQQALAMRIGVNQSTLSRVASDFTARFGLMARFQAKAETKDFSEN